MTGAHDLERLPGGLAAHRYAEGPETWFPEILAVYDEVHTWVTEGGRIPVGPPGRPGTTPRPTPSRSG